ncbi:MAG: hypothetical protein KTR33_14940, partial [Gammaproteobacteria bacterium]|nr:hypothetical protein [Gammaproteobacteria bacterium]
GARTGRRACTRVRSPAGGPAGESSRTRRRREDSTDERHPGDPVGEAALSFLDGHIALSQELAEAGHYPAIDIERSISRVMNNLVSDSQLEQARVVKSAWAHLRRNRDLVSVGAYQAGSDPLLDTALQNAGQMNALLQQDSRLCVSMSQSTHTLQELASSLKSADPDPAQGMPSATGDQQ